MVQRPTLSDPDTAEPTPEVVERAAEWLAHLESGDANETDRKAFENWRAEHPSHGVAITRMGGFGNGSVERETLRRLFLRPRRPIGSVVLTIAILLGVGWLSARLPAVQLYFADERTSPGEMRDIPLSDGNRVVLASDSAADFDLMRERGIVRLLRGEILAKVAKGQARAFRVETTDGTAEALGTAFTVRKEDHSTTVAVISSKVRACPVSRDLAKCIILSPGERVRLAEGEVSRLPNVAPGDMAAWTEGWLPADGIPLASILDELNRWRESPIRFDRRGLADLRVSGIFPLRDTDSALANLARSQPIMIDRSNPDAPLVRRAPK